MTTAEEIQLEHAAAQKLYAIGVYCCERYDWPLSDLRVFFYVGSGTALVFENNQWTNWQYPRALSHKLRSGAVSIPITHKGQFRDLAAGSGKLGTRKKLARCEFLDVAQWSGVHESYRPNRPYLFTSLLFNGELCRRFHCALDADARHFYLNRKINQQQRKWHESTSSWSS